ncbi:MAG: hypothetical protein ACRD3Y_04280 [Bryobacteraceae bacterium]
MGIPEEIADLKARLAAEPVGSGPEFDAKLTAACAEFNAAIDASIALVNAFHVDGTAPALTEATALRLMEVDAAVAKASAAYNAYDELVRAATRAGSAQVQNLKQRLADLEQQVA